MWIETLRRFLWERESEDPCMSLNPPCFTEEDRFSLEALQTIHKQMDDDKDGGIEVDESDEFIREDMKYKDATNKHSHLHREDKHITVEDLWKRWKTSEVLKLFYGWEFFRAGKASDLKPQHSLLC
ncbi:PREDICTED: stromal interaction molecule 2-like [Dipodomys ordii]|uniref:Stromal interaction molecule 2-like n=1 Tax=Dipodomys ordii TaxID=10020 RepID=A0A1S3EK73_DIPOR|nr:PREDICTED: stromal interaction molecule 2-like [Dipodomys ordii]